MDSQVRRLARRASAPLLAAAALLAATPALRAQTADEQTLASYRLDASNLAKFEQASRNMATSLQNPAVREQAKQFSASTAAEEDPRTIADMAARLDRFAPARQAIASAGLPTTEYVTFQLSLFQAGMAMMVMDRMQGATVPEGTPKENVDFVRANKERLEKLTAELKAMQPEEPDAPAEPAEPPTK
jgi:hypothetical protein